ncbi:MAG: hypothetical protein HYR88_07085 [Verrucomicrobia bacterium]|nr:hypothetical protein [Verrucomicrobiota bacterium]MBI3869573.1 hypothetical protein [Verrucomicrobiota bacterium]
MKRIQSPIASRDRAAFALPDLALLLGTILILAALVIPAVSASRERGRAAQCVENLNHISKALLKQAQDADGKLPVSKSNPAPGGWWTYKEGIQEQLAAGGAAAGKVFACPSDRGYGLGDESATPFSQSPKHSFTSYVFNGVTLPGIPNVSGRALSSIRNPARTLLIMEFTAHGPLSWHRSRTGLGNAPFYDGAESIVGFVDGHVAMTRFYYDGVNAAYTRDPIPGYDYQFSGD